jgi:hypothetical protein
VVTFSSSKEGNTQFPKRCAVLYYSDNVQHRNERQRKYSLQINAVFSLIT